MDASLWDAELIGVIIFYRAKHPYGMLVNSISYL